MCFCQSVGLKIPVSTKITSVFPPVQLPGETNFYCLFFTPSERNDAFSELTEYAKLPPKISMNV